MDDWVRYCTLEVPTLWNSSLVTYQRVTFCLGAKAPVNMISSPKASKAALTTNDDGDLHGVTKTIECALDI